MRRVRSKDTVPAMRDRRLLHSPGYRCRLYARDLPGCPDLVFRPRRNAIFVPGCFWHRHLEYARTRSPKSPERLKFRQQKSAANVTRDTRNQAALGARGWDLLVIWECASDDPAWLKATIVEFLG